MRPAAYASLLRAMARATIESGLVPVRKDAQHDPVELIAAAIEVCVDRWDRDGPRSTPQRHDFWKDLVARVVAFEALFGLRAGDERQHGALLAVVRAIEGDNAARTLDSLVDVFDRARIAVAVIAKSRPEHSEAMLAEIVVAGVGSSASACTAAWIPNALPLAAGIVLVRDQRFVEALVPFDAILDRVPTHTIALQQAARCSVECGAFEQAQSYSARAARRSRGTSAGSAIGNGRQSGSAELADEHDQTPIVTWSRAPQRLEG